MRRKATFAIIAPNGNFWRKRTFANVRYWPKAAFPLLRNLSCPDVSHSSNRSTPRMPLMLSPQTHLVILARARRSRGLCQVMIAACFTSLA
jgi:hypothetical protein